MEDDEVNSIAKNLRKQLVNQGPQTSYEMDIKSSRSSEYDIDPSQIELRPRRHEFSDMTPRAGRQTPRGIRVLR